MPKPADGKILVELYCLKPDCDPIAELVSAVAKSVRWKDRIDVRVRQYEDGPRVQTPYGSIRDDTVVICGTHVIRQADYGALMRALEDCEEQGPA